MVAAGGLRGTVEDATVLRAVADGEPDRAVLEGVMPAV